MGYLAEFWNSITDAVVGGTTYTIQFFQQIGNAVAGAVGNVFLDTLHAGYDFLFGLGWFIDAIVQLIVQLFKPLVFISDLLVKVIQALITAPPIENLYTVNFQALGFIQGFPLWSTLTAILYALILFIGILTAIKLAKL